MASIVCDKCKKLNRNEQLDIKCSGFCNNQYHKKCVKLSDYDVELIRKNCGINFLCDKCVDKFEILKSDCDKLIKMIESNNSSIVELVEQKFKTVIECVNELKKNVSIDIKKNICKKNEDNKQKPALYSDSLKLPVIIKPKNKSKDYSCESTKKEIKSALIPSSVSAKITDIKNINEAGIMINCANKESADKIQSNLSQKLSQNYDIYTPKIKNPYLKIVGLNDNISKEKIIEAIKLQNNVDFKELKCHKIFEVFKKKGTYNAIVEVDSDAYNNIITSGRINIEWDRCRVYEYFNILRCFKCWGFNHKAEGCTVGSCCYNCGNQNHLAKDCDSVEKICINCKRMKDKVGLANVDINHDTKSIECPLYKRKINFERKKTNY